MTPQIRTKVNWLHVVVYYLIACCISWPFFWWRDILHWEGFKGPGFLKTSSIMWGPGIAAFICLALFRKSHNRTITILGSDPVKSLLFWFAPFLILAILGVNDEQGQFSHTFPLMISLFGALTVFGEEMGWRGFLQDAVRPLKPFTRYCIIGVMWELWHFTNRTHDKTILQIAITLSLMLPITICIAWIIGLATERSKSILVAAAIHGWINLLFEASGTTIYIGAALAVCLWSLLLWKWDLKLALLPIRIKK